MDPAEIASVRRFNRTVTQRVGALNDALLARGRPLGQARLLWEVGRRAGTDVRALRARLDLDSGYLSRMLRTLEEDGLITIAPSEADGRVRTVRLTGKGAAERAELDRLSDQAAAAILGPLSTSQRARLIAAMTEVQKLLTASAIEIAVTDPRHPGARQCVQTYFDELASRFDDGFDPASSIPADDHELTPPEGIFLLATIGGEPAGCGAVKFHGDDPAEIKRMWVAPAMRGTGLGRRILHELEGHAAASGARTVRLETNRTLHEAISMYRAVGYREVAAFNDEPYAHHWFEKILTVPPYRMG
jgi:DNA-binding MarR family transcriptional regulator/GNAT superfamily N-acetyltransferase